MPSGGACRSLWERLCVWMTLTASVSRAPVIQLNPDRADEAVRARAGAYASVRPDRMRRHARKTWASTQTRTGGRLVEGPVPLSAVPVAGDWGHTAASYGKKERKRRGESGEMERRRHRLKGGGNDRVRDTLEEKERGNYTWVKGKKVRKGKYNYAASVACWTQTKDCAGISEKPKILITFHEDTPASSSPSLKDRFRVWNSEQSRRVW